MFYFLIYRQYIVYVIIKTNKCWFSSEIFEKSPGIIVKIYCSILIKFGVWENFDYIYKKYYYFSILGYTKGGSKNLDFLKSVSWFYD